MHIVYPESLAFMRVLGTLQGRLWYFTWFVPKSPRNKYGLLVRVDPLNVRIQVLCSQMSMIGLVGEEDGKEHGVEILRKEA